MRKSRKTERIHTETGFQKRKTFPWSSSSSSSLSFCLVVFIYPSNFEIDTHTQMHNNNRKKMILEWFYNHNHYYHWIQWQIDRFFFSVFSHTKFSFSHVFFRIVIHPSIYLISATKKKQHFFPPIVLFFSYQSRVNCRVSYCLFFLVIRVVCFVRCDSVWSIFLPSLSMFVCLFVCYVSYTTWFLMFDCFCCFCCCYWCGFFLTDDNTQTGKQTKTTTKIIVFLRFWFQVKKNVIRFFHQSINQFYSIFCYSATTIVWNK